MQHDGVGASVIPPAANAAGISIAGQVGALEALEALERIIAESA